MIWTKKNYPIAMKYLDVEVRNKAIEIAKENDEEFKGTSELIEKINEM